MRKSKEEIMAEFAQFVFLVAGALLMFFSGVVNQLNIPLSFILFFIGAICIMIRIQYSKEEGA